MGNIILIGMPGAGKSTIGVILAKALGMDFVDTDLIIQNNEKELLQNIIEDKGIEDFIAIEERNILEVKLKEHVIATGGSVVYSDKSMMHLKRDGIVIYLELPYNMIEKRIHNIHTRGIVKRKGQTLESLYKEREELYERYSDITINCKSKDVEVIIEEIITKISK